MKYEGIKANLKELKESGVVNKRIYKYDTDEEFTFDTISLGEYPQRKVDSSLEEKLEDLYNGGELKEGLKCTGRLYSVNGSKANDKILLRHLAEFEYNGERYVRLRLNMVWDFYKYGDGKNVGWLKVEPIEFRILNFDDIEKGQSDILELEAMESLFNNFQYYQMINSYNKDADFVWQNSPIRAFLNSSSTNELDGDKLLTADLQYDFTQTGFLNQALNMTRQASRVYTIPQTETEICSYAFDGCVGLEKIIIPSNVKLIGEGAFNDIKNSQIIFRDHEEEVFLSPMTFRYIGMEYIYLPKTNSDVILSPYLDQSLEKDCLRLDFKK